MRSSAASIALLALGAHARAIAQAPNLPIWPEVVPPGSAAPSPAGSEPLTVPGAAAPPPIAPQAPNLPMGPEVVPPGSAAPSPAGSEPLTVPGAAAPPPIAPQAPNLPMGPEVVPPGSAAPSPAGSEPVTMPGAAAPPPIAPQAGAPKGTNPAAAPLPPFDPATVKLTPGGLPDLSASAAKYPKGPDSDKPLIRNQAPEGRFEVILQTDAHFPNRTLYVPQSVGKNGSVPLLAWENGSCNVYGRMYELFLKEIASNGYLVVAPGEPNKLTGKSTADWQTESIRLVKSWQGAPFVVPENKVAVAGHSCGGGETMRNLANDRTKSIATGIILNAAGQSSATTFGSIEVPMLWVHGGQNDTERAMDANLEWVKQNKPKLPVFEVGLQTGHLGSFWSPRGGIYAETVVKWLDWQLKQDSKTQAWFMGGANSPAAKRGWKVQTNAI